jgi:predicted CXXCH cytochrome family protein
MSNIKWTMVPGIAALAAILTLGLAGTATALHDGGVAHCDACHSMHNSSNNGLLKGSDPSSTCLNCHVGVDGGYHILSHNASNWTPGGDFFWMTTGYQNQGGWPGAPVITSDPDNMGHNVIAADFGLTVDATNSQAPGGSYEAADLGCQSCHNPHGQANGGTANGQLPISVSGSYGGAPAPGTIAGNYRLLGDTMYAEFKNGSLQAPVLAAAPIAVTTHDSAETDEDHAAYGQGMGEWCASCHGDYINDSHRHPSGNSEFLNGQATVYNKYIATGDFTGVAATSFTALVQFERQETDRATLLAGSISTAGPDSSDNVMCLTCHRAHASAFNDATRWDMTHELLAESWPTAANLVTMGAVANSPYYGRDIAADFGDYQRSLCNKCHVKD